MLQSSNKNKQTLHCAIQYLEEEELRVKAKKFYQINQYHLSLFHETPLTPIVNVPWWDQLYSCYEAPKATPIEGHLCLANNKWHQEGL